MTMTAREAYSAAQEYARNGDMVKAAKVLRGVHHPKCEAFLAKVKQTSEYQAHIRKRKTIAGVLLVIAIVIVLAITVIRPLMQQPAVGKVFNEIPTALPTETQ